MRHVFLCTHCQSLRRMWLGPTSSRTFVLPSHGLLFPSIRSHVQKAFDPTYFRYLKSRSWLLFNSALAQCLIHGYRSSPRYVVTLLLSLSASFNRAYTFGLSSCCSTDRVALLLSLQSLRRCHLSLSSYPLALILSLSIFVVVLYIHVTNHSIQASQEFSP